MRACVHIYSMMYMHEEAVALALQVIIYSDSDIPSLSPYQHYHLLYHITRFNATCLYLVLRKTLFS